ncbi:formimidoylglutamate deiminase [Tahibacter amnicola]|uniref:Formimidoylglutamate deiminase n=1 Tax=Tahibacter amnicola TaxID=2976241 RepID=A0ABY6BB41_9GAMM|nr:formimidoylglutamate deiminase [Tahibacter amnicola]UXI67079.1 formimidoylglutamate deiminase [Tahibacter amnicola]
MSVLRADHVWMPHGWESSIDLTIRDGVFATVAHSGDGTAARLGRWVVPGMPNLHSHAFQRAMAGQAERQTDPADSFWTWRETMYAFAGRVQPDDLRAIAAQLYMEMLEAGFTQVCEFHYLHHRPDGGRYDDPAAMSRALIEAAEQTGIGLTLLPTLYQTGGFDGRALSERQRRFAHATDAYLDLIAILRKGENDTLRVGVALHSLRAVPPESLRAVLESGLVDDAPIHIHIAEQTAEVDDCLAVRGARPVQWLLDNAPVDARWTLVHATHLDDAEVRRLAESGAVAGLCPTTEANLGDGVFPLRGYLDAGGVLGVGSDSHISVSPIEELRWLEYGQRLVARRRNIAVSESSDSVGETLWGDALFGGARASGVPIGAIEAGAAPAAGHRADLLVLDDAAPQFAGRPKHQVIDTLVFSGNRNLVRDVMVAGRWCVRDGRHRDRDLIEQRYAETIRRLQD